MVGSASPRSEDVHADGSGRAVAEFLVMGIGFGHVPVLDYVPCAPYRVPIARLAAAQAVLAVGKVPVDA